MELRLNIEYLEQLRAAYSENPREFADRIGISHQTYYNFKNGSGQPTLATIAAMASGLKLKDYRALIIEE